MGSFSPRTFRKLCCTSRNSFMAIMTKQKKTRLQAHLVPDSAEDMEWFWRPKEWQNMTWTVRHSLDLWLIKYDFFARLSTAPTVLVSDSHYHIIVLQVRVFTCTQAVSFKLLLGNLVPRPGDCSAVGLSAITSNGKLSLSPILLSNGVHEQNRSPLAIPQLLAAACQTRIPPRDGFRLFVNNATTLATTLAAPNSPHLPTSDEHSSSSHSQPHSTSIPGSHFTIKHYCLPWHRHATPKSQNLTPQHLGLGISTHGSDAVMDTTALRIQEHIYLLRMI